MYCACWSPAGPTRKLPRLLFISPRTATTHVSNILAKLGVESRTEAATRAIRDGLL